ncbi:SURF1 family protein [Asticcacaulis sp. EMRT-3]|uniref:SURF1 family protein n=1 Tax=Asticcacaulis sp. EMRT-3 TaxID=3040349 RepID=UPI0024AF166F|nr:SURF1 family protein [Asticcacaulis sp. EMRT-3]MDI7775694.1 SURF1 family protein [Asticcacaulis sp. EMRT-3]
MRRILLAVLVIVLVGLLTGLGIWQVQRLAWKTDLIARVNARVHAPVTPPPAAGVAVTREGDEYRHVRVSGHLLNKDESQVYTLSELGAGYWVMTPLKTDDGRIIYINRGFVPMDKKAPSTRPQGQTEGEVTITGLLRMSETKGWLFQQANDPAHDLWYRRDIAVMAQKHHLGPVAPYFIDADTTPNPGGWPRGGLTVIHFPNSHLQYAITWFALAIMLAGASIWLTWFRKPDEE